MSGKNLTSKNSKNETFCGFCVFECVYGKKQKPGNAGIQQKAFWIKKTPSVNDYLYRKTA